MSTDLVDNYRLSFSNGKISFENNFKTFKHKIYSNKAEVFIIFRVRANLYIACLILIIYQHRRLLFNHRNLITKKTFTLDEKDNPQTAKD